MGDNQSIGSYSNSIRSAQKLHILLGSISAAFRPEVEMNRRGFGLFLKINGVFSCLRAPSQPHSTPHTLATSLNRREVR